MRNGLIILLLLFFIPGCHSEPLEQKHKKSSTTKNIPLTRTKYLQLKKLTRGFPNKTQLSIGITNNGVRTYYGFEKRGDSLVEINNKDKYFCIASITKIFTSLLIADLAQSGKISLDEDLKKYYPFKLRYDKTSYSIPVVSLCTHTSGLPSAASGTYSKDGLHAYLKHRITMSSVKAYNYSNLGFIILGDLIQTVTGKTYAEVLEQKILSPMGMSRTKTDVSKIKSECVPGNAGGSPMYYATSPHYPSVGALKSTASDLVLFMEHNFIHQTPSFVTLAQKSYHRRNAHLEMGLGWNIASKNNDKIYFHRGVLRGYTSSLQFAQHKKKGVIVLSNLGGYSGLNTRIDQIAEFFLNE